MKTDKNISIVLFVIAGFLFSFSIGLFIWAGFDGSEAIYNQMGAKIGCGLLVDAIGIPMTIWGSRLIKPTK